MFWLVLGMTLAVALALFVVGIVALPARRAGRSMFTPRGERLFRLSDDAPVGRSRGPVKRAAGEADATKKTAKSGESASAGVARSERARRPER